MTIAFNLFFWDDWLGVSSSTTATTVTTLDLGSGGGSAREDDYPASTEYWDWREAFIRARLKELDAQPAATEKPDLNDIEERLAKFNEERSALIIAMRSSPDFATMMSHGKRLNELNSTISALIAKRSVARLTQ